MSAPNPGVLKFNFTTAAHIPAIEALFMPPLKDQIDPTGQVALRDHDTFTKLVTDGHAAVLEDEEGHVYSMAIGWHLAEPGRKRSEYVEIGSVMSRLPGFGCADVVVAALALHEWWRPSIPTGLIAAEVSDDNKASTRLFRDHLKWSALPKTGASLSRLNNLSYAGLVNYQHAGDSKTWYKSDAAARQHQARMLLDYLNRGTLRNAAGSTIKLDLSALTKTALHESRLQRMVNGETTKKALRPESPLVIRFSEAQDAQTVYNFYLGNQHADFDLRKEEVIGERSTAGQIVLAERDGVTGLSSIGFAFAEPDGGQSKQWSEIGATRSVLNGMNLYPFIIASQVINEFLQHPPAEKFFANVYEDNKGVRHLLNKVVGWKEFEPDDAILTVCKTTKIQASDERSRVWYEATSDTLQKQAAIVCDFIERGHVVSKKGNIVIPLDLSGFSLATTYKKHVEELARGEFGKILTNSRPLPLAQARKTFENYLAGAKSFPELLPK
ncbi:MAG: hypothetical protein ACK4NR_05205 [Micavibrio sp.]